MYLLVQYIHVVTKSHCRWGLHPLGVAARVKPTNSGYFVVADFSLFFPKTCCWRLSATENYKFDLRTFHRALSLRQLNIRLIANTWLPTLFTCSNHYRDISHVRANAYAHYRKNGNKFSSITANNGIHNPWTRFNADKDYLHLHWTTLTTVGNKQLFTLLQLHAWITKTSEQKAALHCNQRGSFQIHFCNLLLFTQSNWDALNESPTTIDYWFSEFNFNTTQYNIYMYRTYCWHNTVPDADTTYVLHCSDIMLTTYMWIMADKFV